VARHRDSGGLDLPVGDPAGLERLDAEVAEVHARATLRVAAPAAALHLAVADLPRHEHDGVPQYSSPWNFGASWCWRVRRSISSSSARSRSSSGSASFTSGVASSTTSSPAAGSVGAAASSA